MTPLTTQQVAERYVVSESTVLAWIKAGELRAVNVSRNPRSRRPHWRITQGAIEAFEAVRTAGTPAPARQRRASARRDVVQFYAG